MPSIVPLSKCHATIVSQVPKSGSSPIQHGTQHAAVADFEQASFEVIGHGCLRRMSEETDVAGQRSGLSRNEKLTPIPAAAPYAILRPRPGRYRRPPASAAERGWARSRGHRPHAERAGPIASGTNA